MRRKLLFILGALLLVVAAVCFVALQPPNEPKYQDVYLSEWLRRYALAVNEPAKQVQPRSAILAIGTNGLPCYRNWMRSSTAQWKRSLRRALPSSILNNPKVFEWLNDDPGLQRAIDSERGICLLGTNAVSAVPELKMMLIARGNSEAADLALKALVGLGEAGIPALEAALADPQHANRWHILWGFAVLVRAGHTNSCLPKLVAALTHPDVHVRLAATNYVQKLAPQLLTNAPAP